MLLGFDNLSSLNLSPPTIKLGGLKTKERHHVAQVLTRHVRLPDHFMVPDSFSGLSKAYERTWKCVYSEFWAQGAD